MSGSTRIQSFDERPITNVVGYVEAITDSAAHGWAWSPGCSDRLTVELRLGQQTLNCAVADGMRDDLAYSGIGDGRHAFELSIPGEFRARTDELCVVVTGEGRTLTLSAPPSATVDSSVLANVQRGLDMLTRSHRLLHRNIQAALLQQPAIGTAMSEISVAQARLQENLSTLELFVIRLEQALANRLTPSSVSSKSNKVVGIIALVATLALFVSCWALFRTIAN